jgi:hypothetical protein
MEEAHIYRPWLRPHSQLFSNQFSGHKLRRSYYEQ